MEQTQQPKKQRQLLLLQSRAQSVHIEVPKDKQQIIQYCEYIAVDQLIICSSSTTTIFNTETKQPVTTVKHKLRQPQLLRPGEIVCTNPEMTMIVVLEVPSLTPKRQIPVPSIKTHFVDTESLDILVFRESHSFCTVQRVPLETVATYFNADLEVGTKVTMRQYLLEKYDEHSRLVNYSNKIGTSFFINVYDLPTITPETIFRKYEIVSPHTEPGNARYLCLVKSIGEGCCVLAYNSKNKTCCEWEIFNETHQIIHRMCVVPDVCYLRFAFLDLKNSAIAYFSSLQDKHKTCQLRLIDIQTGKEISVDDNVMLTPGVTEFHQDRICVWDEGEQQGRLQLTEYKLTTKPSIYLHLLTRKNAHEYGSHFVDSILSILHK